MSVLLSVAQACSAPDTNPVDSRPVVQVVSINSTEISFKWTGPQLQQSCDAEVFSFPPLQYGVCVHQAFLCPEPNVVSFTHLGISLRVLS